MNISADELRSKLGKQLEKEPVRDRIESVRRMFDATTCDQCGVVQLNMDLFRAGFQIMRSESRFEMKQKGFRSRLRYKRNKATAHGPMILKAEHELRARSRMYAHRSRKIGLRRAVRSLPQHKLTNNRLQEKF